VYRERYEPVLVTQREGAGALSGLLVAARSRRDGRLVVAGTNHAEYQAWIGSEESGDSFAVAALRALDEVFPRLQLTFKYLPPGTPSRSLLADAGLGPRCHLQPHPRPLMRVDRGALETSLKKSGTRSRVNRLKRLGDLALERIVDPEAFAAVIDEISRQYDFRQGARHGESPFRADPCKRRFHLALLRQPGLLHVTVLRVGGTVAAAHVGMQGPHMLHLGVFSHSPFLAGHSPGKLHLLMLGLRLADEGIEILDLTPGADPYKDRFANSSDEVTQLTVFGTAAERMRQRARETSLRSLKRAAGVFGITPAMVRGAVAEARRIRLGGLTRAGLALAAGGAEPCVYRADVAARVPSPQSTPRRDALDDLLCFEPARRGESRRAFLADALARLERGEHAYTHAENGRLLHCAWLAGGPQPLPASEPDAPGGHSQDGSLLCDFYRHPAAPARELDRRCLTRALEDAASAGTRFLHLAVPRTDETLEETARALGFRPLDKIHAMNGF
jgi:CelD/BcsL family acetyltransferase involved in cellulose biosynthesis